MKTEQDLKEASTNNETRKHIINAIKCRKCLIFDCINPKEME